MRPKKKGPHLILVGKLGKLSQVGKEILRLGKLSDNIRKVGGEKKKGPHLILVGKLGKFSHIRKVHLAD